MEFTWVTHEKTTPFYARRTFEINKKVRQATAWVCGLGQFVFYLNGRKISDHELDPGWTDYNKIIEYVEFDVTDCLKNGENAAGFEVGNGWFIMDDSVGYTFKFPEFMPLNPNSYKPFGKSLVLGYYIEIIYDDGSKTIIKSDGSEKVTDHEITMSNVYGSEVMDGALRKEGFSKAGFEDSDWRGAALVKADDAPKGKLISQINPPIKVIKSYNGKHLHDANEKAIYDLGQNISGILEITVSGKPGDEINIYPAEKLDENGDADQMAKGWMLIDTRISVILGAKQQTFRQKFTYFAGRYLGVELPEGAAVVSIKADAVTSAWKKAGTFTCDSEPYNRIYDMVEKAVEANMVSVHTDCPTIERFAWQEPNHLMGAAIMYMKDGNDLWRKFFMDMRAGQHMETDCFKDLAGDDFYPGDGLIPAQAPCYIPNVLPVPGMGSFYDIIPWGSSIILGVRWHYLFYGDKSVIEENYDAGMRYFEHLKSKMTKEGFICHGLGDWGNPDEEYARENIETAFIYADAVALREFAEVLERPDEALELAEFAEKLKENYNERLLVKDADGKYCYMSYEHKDEGIVTTQAVEALPLYFRMVPEEAVEDVVAAFRKTLTDKGAFASGEVGMPYIIQTAAAYGMNDLIAEFILKPEHPSYYAFVLDGETTLGEYWEKNPRSHCHDMMGHIIEWYYSGIAGMEIVEPGFKKVRIRPWMPEGMNEFHCEHETPYGVICVDGKRRNGRFEYSYTVPKGVSVVD